MSPTPSVSSPGLVSSTLLRSMGVSVADTWAPLLSASCAAHGINTRLRLAAFLANILNETGNLSSLAENLNYSSDALLAQWPSHFTDEQADGYGRNAYHPANQRMIAELAYGGRMGNGPPGSGDGWLYRGGGGLQTTGKTNFIALGKAIGWTKPLVDLPTYVQTPAGAAESAAIFWQQSGCNASADKTNIAAVRRIINGGTIGLPTVQVLYARLMRLLPSN